MKNYQLRKTGLVLCIVLNYQNIYSQNSEVRALDNFSRIVVSGNAKVFLTQGAIQQVKVETNNQLNNVTTIVNSGKLKIDGKPSTIYITIPEIEEINVSGLGDIRSDSMIHGNSLMINISGKGKIIAPLSFLKIEGNISGSGKMKLSGQVQELNLNISGKGTIDAVELKVQNADFNISGIAKASVDVSNQLDLGISGVGSVYYKTEPKIINKHISGIGKYGIIETNDADTTVVHVGKKRIIIIDNNEKEIDVDADNKNKDNNTNINIDFEEKDHPKKPAKARSHWGGFDLGFNNYFTDGTSTSLSPGNDHLELNTGKSIHIGINIFKHDFKLYKRYIMFTTGIGLSLDNYRFTSDKTLIKNINIVKADYDLNDKMEQITYSKNKLAVNYVTVPFLIQFNTDEKLKKSFHLAGGILLSYKYDSHLKLVYDKEGEKQKTKRRDDFNIEPLRYDATVRIGYRNYTLFGSYAISELFKGGPTLHPFNVGLQLAGW